MRRNGGLAGCSVSGPRVAAPLVAFAMAASTGSWALLFGGGDLVDAAIANAKAGLGAPAFGPPGPKQNAAIGAQKGAETRFALIWWPPFLRILTNAGLRVVRSRGLRCHGPYAAGQIICGHLGSRFLGSDSGGCCANDMS